MTETSMVAEVEETVLNSENNTKPKKSRNILTMLGISALARKWRALKSLKENPEPFLRVGARILVKIIYRTRFSGWDNLPKEGPAVVICNHVSYMDGLVLHCASPRRIRFVIDEDIYNVPQVNYFMKMDRAIPIAPNRASVERALDTIAEGLEQGDVICIFPEGQLTYTGNMSRFKFGIEWIIKRTPVTVYPVALKGLWGSIFSRKYRKSRFKMFPRSLRRKVYAKMGTPIPPEVAKISNLQRVIMDLKNSIHDNDTHLR